MSERILPKSTVSYPMTARSFFRPSLVERFLAAWETRKVRRRRRKEKKSDIVRPLRDGGVRPLTRADMPLIVLTHNDKRFLRSFLKHYRQLGVTRFLCVDDRSADGTREFLAAQPDVDVFVSDVRYADARRGRLWREALVALHGHDRWYLNVDSDEYLVFADCEEKRLPEFIAALEAKGIERCPAPMLDAYASGSLTEARFDGDTDAMPWATANLFDGTGYRLTKEKRAMTLRGGMRGRMFASEAELMKYPLLLWKADYSLGISIHQPLPFRLNFAPIYGVLLHFKFFSDIEKTLENAIADGQYFGGAREYRRIAEVIGERGDLVFENETSVAYAGSSDLVDKGFMVSPFD